MEEQKTVEFKYACGQYLSSLGVSVLRILGRKLQLQSPTITKKDDLIQQIIAVLCGEITPSRTRRGAPIKGDYLPPAVIEKIEELREQYLYGEEIVKTPIKDLSKLEQLGAIQNVDEAGRILLNQELCNRMDVSYGDLVEAKIYKDENEETILVIRKI